MIEIKFRGIDKDSGEFVYGGIAYDVLTASSFIAEVAIIPPRCHGIEVDPSTIGQFTGMKDCNGIEIYEWDVLKCATGGFVWIVLFNDRGSFVAADPSCKLEFVFLDDYQFEVIGNIYENPELLEADK